MNVVEELELLGFPFATPEARPKWAHDLLAGGVLERNAITEKLAEGRTINEIAQTVGISSDEVFEVLTRREDPEELSFIASPSREGHTLEQYERHLERFGPEMILETAAGDLDDYAMRALRGRLESFERTHRWRNGEWTPRREMAAV